MERNRDRLRWFALPHNKEIAYVALSPGGEAGPGIRKWRPGCGKAVEWGVWLGADHSSTKRKVDKGLWVPCEDPDIPNVSVGLIEIRREREA